jgi:hypothetical protein
MWCFFLRFYKRIVFDEYADQFTKPESDEDELELDENGNEIPKEIPAKVFGEENEKVDDDYNWYSLINTLSGGDLLKQNEILQLPFKRCLGHSRFLTQENEKLKAIYEQKNKN